MADTNQPNYRTVQRHFRTWNHALQQAGLEPHHRATPIRNTAWSDADLVRALKDWSRQHGRPPRRTEWLIAAPKRPNSQTVADHFGSWQAGIAHAGLTGA
jgi:hypothetical protein